MMRDTTRHANSEHQNSGEQDGCSLLDTSRIFYGYCVLSGENNGRKYEIGYGR